jgi:hypothetical protein
VSIQIAGHHSTDLLAADDFFELGISAMILNDYGLAAQWLTLATTTRRQHESTAGTQGAELVDLTEAYHQLAHAHSLVNARTFISSHWITSARNRKVPTAQLTNVELVVYRPTLRLYSYWVIFLLVKTMKLWLR